LPRHRTPGSLSRHCLDRLICAAPTTSRSPHRPHPLPPANRRPIDRIQALRAEADGKSLLLLDELGTGTDPTEGAALGVALLRRLVRGGVGCGALTVATTHHSIMTKLKFEDPRWGSAATALGLVVGVGVAAGEALGTMKASNDGAGHLS
jgi:hypothetical protein